MCKFLNDTLYELLKSGEVKIIIGYENGFDNKIRPVLVSTNIDTKKLLYDSRCTQNLAFFLKKKEVTGLGKVAIIANIHTLRGIIRLASENQINNGSVVAIIVDDNKHIQQLFSFEEIEKYLSNVSNNILNTTDPLLNKINTMTISERFNFWKEEMKNCIRCYACRQICPLCYCTKCTVEINKPQWIPTTTTSIGNTEWHIMRAMHLAGRCIECGSCGQVCPSHIPIHLLNIRLAQEIKFSYGLISGISHKEPCAMSTYNTDDKENFIQ